MNFINAYSADNLSFLLKGFFVTLEVAFISIILSFLIGSVIGTLRYAKVRFISPILGIFVETIRNLPLLLIIFFTYFALPEIGIKFSVTIAAIVALTVFEAAMISEIIRSGLNSMGKGQMEAGRSSGLSYFQTLWHIIFPQALRKMIPPMVGQFISLLKDTSLAVVISLPELMHNAQIVNGRTVQNIIPILIFVALLYYSVNYSLSLIARRFETR
jgi:putative glutamine transport system permease protein